MQTKAEKAAYDRVYRQLNREKCLAASRSWKVANKERCREHQRTRRITGFSNPKFNAAYYRAYREAHRERQREWAHDHWLVHRDEFIAQSRTYYQLHRAEILIKRKTWRGAHKEEIAVQNKAWRRINPDRVLAARHARRSQTPGVRVHPQQIAQRDHMICGICHKRVAKKDLSFDHIIPVARGGPHIEWNLQVAHRICNSRRGVGYLPTQMRLPIEV